MRRLLFVSNGIGEDLIASRVIAELDCGDRQITAYPLVGTGVYPPAIRLLDPRRAMPSGGFSMREGFRGLADDLRAGLVAHWWAQRRTLAAHRGQFDLVVAVGDVYCLWMAAHADPRPAFVATADSIRMGPFGWKARQVMRQSARQIFARDPDTAVALQAHGLPALALGNIMLDLLQPGGETFGLARGEPVVLLLPGSRGDAPHNAALLAHAAAAIADAAADARFLVAVAPTVQEEHVRRALAACPGATAIDDHTVRVGASRLRLTRAFADALARATVVMGMAGTAHEQAAAMGCPVVAFPGQGAQFGPQFLRLQQRLLGDALIPAKNWQEAAAIVVGLLRNPDERARRGAAGRERMGPPGGAARVADHLRAALDGNPEYGHRRGSTRG
jgi:uncharacterized protein (TIGR03492 family)